MLGSTITHDVEQFTGGAPQLFEAAGREQLAVLLDHGLTSKSKVADLGCGALRGGRWIMPVLDPYGYRGVEPFPEKVERGLRDFVNPDLVRVLRPRSPTTRTSAWTTSTRRSAT